MTEIEREQEKKIIPSRKRGRQQRSRKVKQERDEDPAYRKPQYLQNLRSTSLKPKEKENPFFDYFIIVVGLENYESEAI